MKKFMLITLSMVLLSGCATFKSWEGEMNYMKTSVDPISITNQEKFEKDCQECSTLSHPYADRIGLTHRDVWSECMQNREYKLLWKGGLKP